MHSNNYQNMNGLQGLAQHTGRADIGGSQSDAMSDAIKRGPDNPPAGVSVNRLFERLSQLSNEVDDLIERLDPVLRPELTGKGVATGRAPSECKLVELLDQAVERVEQATARLNHARDRLCI